MRNFITARFGRDGWDCTDLPLADGETPVLRTFIKQDCSKAIDGVGNAALRTRFLRKKGQSQFDPRTDRETEGQFESFGAVRADALIGCRRAPNSVLLPLPRLRERVAG